MKARPRIAFAAVALVLLTALGCGGGGGSTPASPQSAAVTLAPTSISFGSEPLNATASKTVNIDNTGSSTATVQSVTISGPAAFQVGNWNGPVSLAPGASYAVLVSFTPTSVTNFNGVLNIALASSTQAIDLSGIGVSSGSATVSVAVSPVSAILQTGTTQQFAASVSGTNNTGVTWSVNGVPGGNSAVGTISSTGMYIAPASVPSGSITVSAQSVTDSSKSASSVITIFPAPGKVTVGVTPTSVTVAGGQTQQFTATVVGAPNLAVDWYVNGTQGGNGTTGTISSAGLYSAPACPSQGGVTVTARSVYDMTASANANVTLSGGSSGNGSYYVAANGSDNNNGSACSPWATVAHASSVVGPGSTVHVAPGTYSGPITTSKSGTSSGRIRYISDTQWGALIQCTTGCDMVWSQSGSYVDVLGFELTSTSPITRIGFEWTGSNGLIQGNKVHDIQCSGCVGNGGAGINVDNGSAYTVADANLVYNIDIAGKGKSDSLYVHGIYVHTFYNVISNNLIYRCAGWGIEQGHSVSNSTMVNNTIFECGGGVMIGTGGSPGVSDNNLIYNNILVYNGPGANGHGYGIDAIQNYGTHNTITDNLLFGNQPGNISSALNGAATTTGSITNVDPSSGTLFVKWVNDGTGNYQLLSTSPAVNVGTSSSAPLFDYRGGKRPVNSLWDLGAYEYGAAPGKWPWD
ncbi:MAG TPA: choice-of-anchor D domain-containing protein [Terriglobales bacterium]|nr:choice-of-anchor D domain-containing protein [Terriglobales bacterium]